MAIGKKVATKKSTGVAVKKAPPKKVTGRAADIINRQKAAVKLPVANRVTAQGDVFMCGDDELGNPLEPCIILDYMNEHRFYEGAYQDGDKDSPVCFSLNFEEDAMVPHANSSDKQNDDCPSCPNNQFGSGVGKGKACQNRIRFAILPLGDVTAERIDDSIIYVMSASPTSITNFNEYANLIINVHETSTAFSVVEIGLKKRGNTTSYQLAFEPQGFIDPNAALVKKLDKKIEEATKLLEQPYEPVSEEDEPQKKTAKRKTVKRKAKLQG